MNYSFATLDSINSSWATWLAADKPIIGSCSQVEVLDSAEWGSGVTGIFADADITASGYYASSAVDGKPGITTKPNAAGTGFSLIFNYSTNPITFDFFGIINHNLDSQGVTALKLEIANNNAFSTNLIELHNTNPSSASDDKRIIDLDLYHTGSDAMRYTDVSYIRVSFAKATNFTPEIGQIVFGKRNQLRYKPNKPFDPVNWSSEQAVFRSRNGTRSYYPQAKGIQTVKGNWSIDQTQDVTDLKTWFADTNYGVDPWIWIYDPTTSPSDYLMLVGSDDPSLELPFSGPTERGFSLFGVEQGPIYLALGE